MYFLFCRLIIFHVKKIYKCCLLSKLQFKKLFDIKHFYFDNLGIFLAHPRKIHFKTVHELTNHTRSAKSVIGGPSRFTETEVCGTLINSNPTESPGCLPQKSISKPTRRSKIHLQISSRAFD